MYKVSLVVKLSKSLRSKPCKVNITLIFLLSKSSTMVNRLKKLEYSNEEGRTGLEGSLGKLALR